MHPHLYELDAVNVDIEHNHQDAVRNRDALLARGNQPGHLATITMTLRTTLASVQARFHRVPAGAPEPAAEREPTVIQKPVVTPAESAATA